MNELFSVEVSVAAPLPKILSKFVFRSCAALIFTLYSVSFAPPSFVRVATPSRRSPFGPWSQALLAPACVGNSRRPCPTPSPASFRRPSLVRRPTDPPIDRPTLGTESVPILPIRPDDAAGPGRADDALVAHQAGAVCAPAQDHQGQRKARLDFINEAWSRL